MKELSDLTAPAALEARRVLEKDIQGACVTWARARGYLARKFSSIAQRSVPDYLMFRPGLHFWVEFKAPKKYSTDAQVEEQGLLLKAGLPGFECDDVDKFKQWVLRFEYAKTND